MSPASRMSGAYAERGTSSGNRARTAKTATASATSNANRSASPVGLAVKRVRILLREPAREATRAAESDVAIVSRWARAAGCRPPGRR